MIKVGIIGEDPNDTIAISNLLRPKFGAVAQFITICKRITGAHLDSGKFFKMVALEARSGNCDIVICVRDLDGFESQMDKVKIRHDWFSKVKKEIGAYNPIFLLNIWEIEAMIFADPTYFNKKFNTKVNYAGDPSKISNPKERLRVESKKAKKVYCESDCKDLFSDKVVAKCIFFKDFIEEFKSLNKILGKVK